MVRQFFRPGMAGADSLTSDGSSANTGLLTSLADGVTVAVSTTQNGTMADKTRLDQTHIMQNRRRWLKSLAIDPSQTVIVPLVYERDDYCRYRIVESVQAEQPVLQGESDATHGVVQPVDALVTATAGVALFLPVADCIAAALYDPVHRVLMVSHLGRHSLEQDGGVRSVQFLQQQFGTNPADVRAWLSPAVGKDSYKIYKLDNKGMKQALHEQLGAAGIIPAHINDSAIDTDSHDDYYSHSAFLAGQLHKKGRFAMVAVMN